MRGRGRRPAIQEEVPGGRETFLQQGMQFEIPEGTEEEGEEDARKHRHRTAMVGHRIAAFAPHIIENIRKWGTMV